MAEIYPCPNCGASLNVESERENFYCSHCGILINKKVSLVKQTTEDTSEDIKQNNTSNSPTPKKTEGCLYWLVFVTTGSILAAFLQMTGLKNFFTYMIVVIIAFLFASFFKK
jgi:DNA-directed RNA polymerase subunit RPC12/RpoP